MPKLVVLTEGLTGRAHELKAEKTTIGRVEDNTFQIPHPSVSSHHCEVILRGNDVVVRDLGSTNGSFVGGQQITEIVLKPSQVLRVGQVDVRLEVDAGSSSKPKQVMDHTQIVPPGIKLEELSQTDKPPTPLRAGFEKKSKKGVIIFAAAVVAVAIITVLILLFLLKDVGPTP